MKSFLDLLFDNLGLVLLVIVIAIIVGLTLTEKPADPPAIPSLPTAETKFVVTVQCNGGFLNTTTEFFSTNHPDGKGPAFESRLLASEVSSFDAGNCLRKTVGVTRIWSSQGPFDGNRFYASQDVINQFLADEAANP